MEDPATGDRSVTVKSDPLFDLGGHQAVTFQEVLGDRALGLGGGFTDRLENLRRVEGGQLTFAGHAAS